MIALVHPLAILVTAVACGAALGMAGGPWTFVALLPAAITALAGVHARGPARVQWFLATALVVVGAAQAVRLRPPGELPVGTFRDAQPRRIEGRVVEPPRRTGRGLRLLLDDVVVTEPRASMRLNGLVTFEVDALPRTGPLGVGAKVRAWARISRIHRVPSPGAADVASILLDRRVVARGRAETVEVVTPASSVLDGVRDRFRTAADATDTLTAPLLEAMILGDQARLDPERQERWRLAGITHILSISGLHVSVVALVLDTLARWLLGALWPGAIRRSVRGPAALVGVVGGWAYVLVAGAPIAAVRSAWMVTGLLGARLVPRHNTAGGALGLAALLSLASDPWALLDPSFQLSYVAVVALIVTAPAGRRLRSYTEAWSSRAAAWAVCTVAETLLASAACTVATLPILLAHFGSVSVAGLVTNVVAVPLSSVAVVLPGFGALLLASLGVAGPLLWVSVWLVPWLERVATWGATLGAIDAPARTVPELLAATVGAGLLLAATRATRLPTKRLVFGAIAVAIGVVGLPHPRPNGLEITFLAVGHGDAAVVRLPDGRDMLIDGGGDPAGLRDVGRTVVLPGLRALGVSRLDVMVLSHPHPDHFRGLVAVAEAMPVGELWWTGQRSGDPELARLLTALDAQGTRRRTFGPDAAPMDFGGATVDILYPRLPANADGAHIHDHLGANDNSLVVRIAFGSFVALFTGDVEREAEALLLSAGLPLTATLLKVPHHGSRTSSTPAFLAAVRPSLAVTGSADEGHFAFPDPDVEARYGTLGIPLWITGRYGALQVVTDGVEWRYGAP